MWHRSPVSQLIWPFLNPHPDLQDKANVIAVNEHLILSFVLPGKHQAKATAESCIYTWEGNRIIYYRVCCTLVVLQWLYETATEKFGFILPLYLKFFKYISTNVFLWTSNKWVLLPPPQIKIVQNPLSTNAVTTFNSYERSCNFRKEDHDSDIYYRNF